MKNFTLLCLIALTMVNLAAGSFCSDACIGDGTDACKTNYEQYKLFSLAGMNNCALEIKGVSPDITHANVANEIEDNSRVCGNCCEAADTETPIPDLFPESTKDYKKCTSKKDQKGLSVNTCGFFGNNNSNKEKKVQLENITKFFSAMRNSPFSVIDDIEEKCLADLGEEDKKKTIDKLIEYYYKVHSKKKKVSSIKVSKKIHVIRAKKYRLNK